MKAWLSSDSLKVFNTIISAGTLEFFFNSIISPTNKSEACFFILSTPSLFDEGTKTSIVVEFVLLSCILLLISSYNSLAIETQTTKAKGEIYVNRNPTFKSGKNWVIDIIK